MNVNVQCEDRMVLLTDEHSSSSYGIPVAVVDGLAYGPNDCVNIVDCPELSWLTEPAFQALARPFRLAHEAGTITDREYDLFEKFSALGRYY